MVKNDDVSLTSALSLGETSTTKFIVKEPLQERRLEDVAIAYRQIARYPNCRQFVLKLATNNNAPSDRTVNKMVAVEP
jgi:hypothetical protein